MFTKHINKTRRTRSLRAVPMHVLDIVSIDNDTFRKQDNKRHFSGS